MVKAWIMTLSVCLPTLYWLYSHKSFSIIATIVPEFMILVTFSAPKYKDKLLKMFIFYLIFSSFAFSMSILQNHKLMIVFIIFITIYAVYSSNKLFFIAGSAWVLGFQIFLPEGWYEGANRILELSFCLIVNIVLLIIFEYFTTKLIIRNTLKHTIDLVNDLFCIYTTKTTKKLLVNNIKNKYIYTKEIAYRGDIEVENIFKNNKYKFYHRTYLSFIRLDTLIFNSTYFLAGNRRYAKAVSMLYICYRRLSRDMEFLAKYIEVYDLIEKNFPETYDIIKNISDRLQYLRSILIENNFAKESFKNNKLTEEWLIKYARLTKSKSKKLSKEEHEIYFSIKCILSDLDTLKLKYSNKKVLKILKLR
ncbi:MAG: hypothetical protein GY756_16790 [bacterium]|nr:hypothetical protein [bacterium]